MNRRERLTMAAAAVSRAANLARDAESYASSDDYRHKAEPTAAAGTVWANIARAHAAIAAALPDIADETLED